MCLLFLKVVSSMVKIITSSNIIFSTFYQLFGCPKANFAPVQGGSLTYPLSITALLFNLGVFVGVKS